MAAALFGVIVFHHKHPRQAVAAPARLLPDLQAAQVSAVQVRPSGAEEIRVERTNNAWRMTAPVSYPAESERIEHLIASLERLAPATTLSEAELKERPNFEEEFGFSPEQTSVFITGGDYRAQLKVGAKTAPGDQVFLQVAGRARVFLADADLLKLIPTSADDWRDRALLDLRSLVFDRIAVSNGNSAFQVERDPAIHGWRLISPNQARANSARIEESLQILQTARVNRFIPDEPKPDLEALGLQPPEWQLAFAQNTQIVAVLQFGKSPTNEAKQVCARLADQRTIVTTPKDSVSVWRASASDFRDPHLLNLPGPVTAVEVKGLDSFTVTRQTNDTWRVQPQGFTADADLVKEMLSSLTEMQVTQFVKDVVIEPDLALYGLATPSRKYVLKTMGASSVVSSNTTTAELHFGTNQDDRIFARRTDETSVYAVPRSEVERLPIASWQLRERKIWDHSDTEVASITIRQNGKTRQILHKGERSWSLAPGSQGSIEDLIVDETVRDLCRLSARSWVTRGAAHRAEYGFEKDGPQITLDLKSGEKLTVELGGQSAEGFPCAAVCLNEELWIFDFSPSLHRDMMGCLTIPKNLL